MKRLQHVIAMTIVCAFCSVAFTSPSHKTSDNSSHGPAAKKWKHTVWVDPWVNLKKAQAKKVNVAGATVYFYHEINTPSTVWKCRVGINGQMIDAGPTTGTDTYNSYTGWHIGLEIDVHPTLGYFTAYIEDITTSTELFYQDTGFYLSTYVVAQEGHEYMVWAHCY